MSNIENEKKVVLNEKLQGVLDKLGDTPMTEPEIAKVLDARPLKKSKAIKIALKRDGLDIKDFKAMELAHFFNAITEHIVSFTDSDGNYKSTENTKDFNLPDFEQVEEINDLNTKIQDSLRKQIDIRRKDVTGEEIKEEDVKKLIDSIEKNMSKLKDLLWAVAGLEKDSLSEWEQDLVTRQIVASSYEVEKTSLGKQ